MDSAIQLTLNFATIRFAYVFLPLYKSHFHHPMFFYPLQVSLKGGGEQNSSVVPYYSITVRYPRAVWPHLAASCLGKGLAVLAKTSRLTIIQ